MAKRTGNSSVNSSIRQQTKTQEESFGQLLEAQQASLGELTSIKKLLEISKQVKTETAAAAAPDLGRIQEKMFELAKEQLKGNRKYWKTQEEFQKEWDKEAKDIAEMAKGMNVFKTLGDKMADKKAGLSEKYGIANGGLKKTVLGAMNVGGIFNKTLARDEFVKKQQALGSKASVKELKADFAGAQKATKAIQKNESKIDALKKLTGADEDTLREHHKGLFDERQTQTEQLSKYDRGARMFSPDKKNAQMAGLIPKSEVPELGKTPTSTAAEAAQGAEVAEEGKRTQEEELHYLKIIAENTGGAHKNAGDKKPEEKKPDGGGLLDSIFGMLSSGLMTAFKALLNPGAILKALGKVFAIGMIVGALFEGIMDGFEEFQKTGDIGKALIAGLAGIIDFLTFGLFDKEKIKEVIGDMSKWLNDHLIKPYIEFITSMKDAFMSMIENIGIPEIKFKIPVIGKEVAVGPFYPFKSDAKPQTAAPSAPAPTTANQVEQKSAENADAKDKPAVANKTNVVNAPVTTNNNTTQVQMRPPIRNQESSQSRYLSTKYA
jgi:esterase/lipase